MKARLWKALERRGPGPLRAKARERVMDQPDELHRFWSQPEPPGNAPTYYITPTHRSELLVELIADLPRDARILEVGCNVGRNLAWLHDEGWPHVAGVEISAHAIALLRETYPQLGEIEVHQGRAEDVLPTLPDDSFDLVFTMAVLEHIHPSSSIVFDRMAALAPQVLAIEPAGHLSHRQYPHDIEDLFTSRGMALASTQFIGDHPKAGKGLANYTAWRFTRPPSG